MVDDARAELLRDRFRQAPVVPPPAPWHRVGGTIAVGGLVGVGFAADPTSGADLLLVVSHQGRGVFDCATGSRVARDHEVEYPDGPELTCAGIGPVADVTVRVAGLFGGGLHLGTPDGWGVEVVAPDWPDERVVLTAPTRHAYYEPDRGGWSIVHDEQTCELRAVGFSPGGGSLVIASSCAIDLYHRPR